MKDLVSIIVPVYNVEKYLKKCLDSILLQTYQNIEIILVDDGSTDLSGKICNDYSSIDKRIRVFHKKNSGLSDARNYALDHVKGNYITFVDSDDYIECDYVNYLYTIIKEYNADVSSGNICCVDEKNNIIGRTSNNKNVHLFSKKESLKEILDARVISNSISSKLFKAHLFSNIRFPYGRLYEDVATTYKLFINSNLIVHGEKIIYYYLFRSGSITKQNFSYKKMDLLISSKEMVDDIIALYPDLKNTGDFRLFDAYISILSTCNNQLIEKEMLANIKNIRRKIILSSQAGYKRRLFALSTYFGKWFIKSKIK